MGEEELKIVKNLIVTSIMDKPLEKNYINEWHTKKNKIWWFEKWVILKWRLRDKA